MMRCLLILALFFHLLFVTPAQAQPVPRQNRTISSWVAAHQAQIVKELVDLLSIPNVAADRSNIRRNAEHLRAMFAARGFKAELLETSGNPLVFGELAVPGATHTLLLYAHYDGQPVEAKAWQQASPFVPILRTARVDRGGTEIPDMAAPRALRAGVAALRPLGVRRQVADRGDLRGDRRARGRVAPPDLERAGDPRR